MLKLQSEAFGPENRQGKDRVHLYRVNGKLGQIEARGGLPREGGGLLAFRFCRNFLI